MYVIPIIGSGNTISDKNPSNKAVLQLTIYLRMCQPFWGNILYLQH